MKQEELRCLDQLEKEHFATQQGFEGSKCSGASIDHDRSVDSEEEDPLRNASRERYPHSYTITISNHIIYNICSYVSLGYELILLYHIYIVIWHTIEHL